jgi:hypothetical protein
MISAFFCRKGHPSFATLPTFLDDVKEFGSSPFKGEAKVRVK